MRANVTTGIELEYDTFGSPDDPALLLVMGFTAQMTAWDEAFCRQLADRGRYVIRFDNRDCGLSTKLDGLHVDVMAVMAAALARTDIPPVPYTLTDMAADAVGLLDNLGIDRAHLVGASMGGMIVQTMAIEHPDRLLSATSIMSSTGNPDVGSATSDAMQVLLSVPPDDRDAYIARSGNLAVWSSKRYFDPERAAELAAAAYDRSFYPEGATRQLPAIFATGDRTAALAGVTVPTLVIHGLDDELISPTGGRATAEAIPGAHLLEVADMGHDLPEQLWPLLVGAIVAHGEVAATQTESTSVSA